MIPEAQRRGMKLPAGALWIVESGAHFCDRLNKRPPPSRLPNNFDISREPGDCLRDAPGLYNLARSRAVFLNR